MDSKLFLYNLVHPYWCGKLDELGVEPNGSIAWRRYIGSDACMPVSNLFSKDCVMQEFGNMKHSSGVHIDEACYTFMDLVNVIPGNFIYEKEANTPYYTAHYFYKQTKLEFREMKLADLIAKVIIGLVERNILTVMAINYKLNRPVYA